MSCQDEYQNLIDTNSIMIVDKQFFNRKDEIDITIFLKNNSNVHVEGIATFEIEFNKSNKNKLKVAKVMKDSVEQLYKELSEKYSDLVLKEITAKIEDIRFKYDSLKSISEVTDSTDIFKFNINQEINIISGGLSQLKFSKQIPTKYLGIKDVGYIDKIKIIKILKITN